VASEQVSPGNAGSAYEMLSYPQCVPSATWCFLEMLEMNDISHREDEMRIEGRSRDL